MQFIQPIITALYFVSAGILLFLAYNIIRDNASHRLNRITGLMLFFAALGPIFLAFGEIVGPIASADAPFEESLVYNLYFVWELFFPALLLFSWIYPVDRFTHMKRPRWRYFIFVPHLFHILLVIAFRNPEKAINLLDIDVGEGFLSLIMEPLTYVLKWLVLGFTLVLSSERTLFALINGIYIGLAVYFLSRGRMQLENQSLKSRSTIIIGGITAALLLYMFGFIIPEIFSIEISEGFLIGIILAALVIGVGSLTWSIINQQFLNVTVLFRQSLVYTITSGILVGVYILIVSQADKLITSILGEQTTIVNIAFIVLALILFQPINNRLDNLIRKFFIKSKTDYRNIMEQLSRQLVTVLEPEKLLETIETTFTKSIMINRIYFVLFDDKLNEYVLFASKGFGERIVIDRKDLFLGAVGQQNRPVMFSHLANYGGEGDLYGLMNERKVEVILPLKEKEHMLGFIALTGKISGFRYNAEDLTMLGVLANQLITVLANARLYLESQERRRLDEEINMARQIQIDLLPKHPPDPENHNICAVSIPSRTIGGDFYDFIPKENSEFAMVIADASGKGMQAALIVTQIQAMIRSEIDSGNNISKMIKNINHNVFELTSSDKFATLFYGEYNPQTRQLKYSNAGHNYPILVRNDGTHELLSKGGMVIGAFDSAVYEEGSIVLNDGDLLFLYTDGLSEAQNVGSENYDEYGEQRIIEFVTNKRLLSSEELIDAILEDARRFDPIDPPRDDTTIIIMKATEVTKGE
jgi:sigma-B regulation protein RsbU (phosphoserine phosphatase)